jgi:hypothetical protein
MGYTAELVIGCPVMNIFCDCNLCNLWLLLLLLLLLLPGI